MSFMSSFSRPGMVVLKLCAILARSAERYGEKYCTRPRLLGKYRYSNWTNKYKHKPDKYKYLIMPNSVWMCGAM